MTPFLVFALSVFLALSGLVQAGFESLSKPFTGAQESEWEQLASRLQAGNAARSRSAASASQATHRYSNITANATITGTGSTASSGPTEVPFLSTYTGSVAPKCNASLQNSYQRMVTNIEEYTLTDGSVQTAIVGDHDSYDTFTLTGPTTYTTIVTQAFRPGRVWQAYYPDNYQCCMDCYVYFPEVEVYYWPVPESQETCANESAPLVTAQAVLPSGAAKTAEARLNTLYSNASLTGEVTTVNANGFTFVSPSVYVAFGDVSAGDACGAVGKKYMDVTLAFAPGELQTVTSLGHDHYDTTLGTRAFDPRNVLCPPDFVPEHLFVEQDSLAGIHTYRPRIQIPSALQNLDPKWSTCIVDPYEGIDPPRQLVPASGFGDDTPVATTSADPVQQPTPAQGAPELPQNTGISPANNPRPQTHASAKPGQDPLEDPPSQTQTTPGDSSSPAAGDPKQAPSPNAGDRPRPKPARPQAHASVVPGLNPLQDPPKKTQAAAVDPGTSSVRDSSQGGKEGASDSGNGQSDPPVNGQGHDQASKGSSDPQSASPNVSGGSGTPGSQGDQGSQVGQEVPKVQGGRQGDPSDQTPDLSSPQPAVVVQGQTIKQGAAPVTIGGKPVEYSQGSIYVGGTAAPAPAPVQVAAPSPQKDPKPSPVNLGGFKFTPTVKPQTAGAAVQPAVAKPAVVVQGQTIQEGAPAVTVDGNRVSYTAGSIHVGNAVAPVPQGKVGQAAAPINVGGLSFTPTDVVPSRNNQGSGGDRGGQANPAVVVEGQTIHLGAPPVTIDGKAVSYSSGSLHVGNAAAPISPPNQGQPAPAPVQVGGLTATPIPVANQPQIDQNSQNDAKPVVIVKGQTLTENGAPATINGKPVVYSDGSIFAGGTRVAIPTVQQGQAASPVNVAGLRITPQPVQIHGDGPVPAVIVAGHTLTEGAPAVRVNGAKLAYSRGSVYVNGIAAPLPTAPPTSQDQKAEGRAKPVVIGGLTFKAAPVVIKEQDAANAPVATIAGHAVTPAPGGGLVVAGTTLSKGGSAITVSGTPISIGPSGLLVGDHTFAFPSYPTPHVITTVGNKPISQDSAGNFIIAGSTLTPGNAAFTISGTPISLNPTALVIGTNTIPLKPIATLAGQPIYENSNGAIVLPGDQTLSPNAPAITVSGTRYSLSPSDLVIGTSSIPLSPASVIYDSANDPFTLLPPNNQALLLRPGATLSLNGPSLTISGTPFALETNRAGSTILVEGTKTIPLMPAITRPAVTVGGEVITADSEGDFIVGGNTLTENGQAVTISGERVSLGWESGKEILVVGSSTRIIGSGVGSGVLRGTGVDESGTRTTGVGAPSGSTAAGEAATGAARRLRCRWMDIGVWIGGIVFWIVY